MVAVKINEPWKMAEVGGIFFRENAKVCSYLNLQKRNRITPIYFFDAHSKLQLFQSPI